MHLGWCKITFCLPMKIPNLSSDSSCPKMFARHSFTVDSSLIPVEVQWTRADGEYSQKARLNSCEILPTCWSTVRDWQCNKYGQYNGIKFQLTWRTVKSPRHFPPAFVMVHLVQILPQTVGTHSAPASACRRSSVVHIHCHNRDSSLA